jgi:hypothetical protein
VLSIFGRYKMVSPCFAFTLCTSTDMNLCVAACKSLRMVSGQEELLKMTGAMTDCIAVCRESRGSLPLMTPTCNMQGVACYLTTLACSHSCASSSLRKNLYLLGEGFLRPFWRLPTGGLHEVHEGAVRARLWNSCDHVERSRWRKAYKERQAIRSAQKIFKHQRMLRWIKQLVHKCCCRLRAAAQRTSICRVKET